MARTTVYEYDIADTYTSRVNPAVNYGSYSEVFIYTVGGVVSEIALFKLINKVNIPFGKKVIAISLEITGSDSAASSNIRVHRCISAWDEMQVTWRTNPKLTYLGEGLASATSFVVGTTYTIQLTGLIDIDSLYGYGIALTMLANSDPEFYSTESGSATPPRVVLTFADAPLLPDNLSPANGDAIDKTVTPTRFSWDYHASPVSLYAQKSYLLQISTDALTWTDYAATTANEYADITSSLIPDGYFYWRVQTIDTDDVPSDWSEIQICHAGSIPVAPSIVESVFTSSRPRLTWTTVFDQSAYQVQILYDTEVICDSEVATTDQYFDCPVALDNDTEYTVRVRAKNDIAVWSAWAEDSISTNYGMPTVPTFVAVKKNYGIELTITNPVGDDTVVRNDVYREDGDAWVLIGSTITGVYDDWSAAVGINTYKVIAVGESSDAESAEGTATLDLSGGVLTCVDDPTLSLNVKFNITYRKGGEYGAVLREFAGRELPVAEYGEQIQRTLSINMQTRDYGDCELLDVILSQKSTLLYRDANTKIYGMGSNPDASKSDYERRLYNISFVLSEIEHSEAVTP